jgi:hypothetical protein
MDFPRQTKGQFGETSLGRDEARNRLKKRQKSAELLIFVEAG